MTIRLAAAPVAAAGTLTPTANPPAAAPVGADAKKRAPKKRTCTATSRTDVFLVTSTTHPGCRHARTVLAADQFDAYSAHREHYPNDEIVRVDACCRHCGNLPWKA